MDTTVYPSKSTGSLTVVSSKSVAHRAIIAACLSNSTCDIFNVDLNDDILRTIEGLNSLGASITYKDNVVHVKGFDIFDTTSDAVINAHESGSTLRFLIPIASIKSDVTTFVGTKTLMSRPLDIYEELYKQHNLKFELKHDLVIEGKLSILNARIRGDVSSQFISGLMFVLPLLKKDSTLEIIEPYESKSYVDLTVSVLKDFGIDIQQSNNKYYIKGEQKYSSIDYTVESDFSQAAFFAVLGAINNDVSIQSLNFNSKQGDKYIFEILSNLGVHLNFEEDNVIVKKSNVGSGVFDLKDCPDLGPILCILGLFSSQSIELINVSRLRIKESDRLFAMKTELEKFGANIILTDNTIKIFKLKDFKSVDTVDSHNDHRIAMALSILATTLNHPLTIKNSDCINKSYPDFYKHLNRLSIKTSHEDSVF